MPARKLVSLVAVGLVAGAVATWSQVASEAEAQSEVSRILNAHGILYVLETHDLPGLAAGGADRVECEIVILRALVGTELSINDDIRVGLVFTIKGDYTDDTARLDADEAQALLASLELMSRNGKSILDKPTVNTEDWAAEIHYRTKEKVMLAAFVDRDGHLTFGLKVGPRADWAILTDDAVATLADNLRQTIDSSLMAVNS